MFNEFCQKFEEHIERIIKTCGVSVEQFFSALKILADKDEENKFYVDVLLSVTEYSNFVDMMRNYKNEQKK